MLDAIIVGAGYAGITAARDLKDRGASSVVLEARDRIGGRTHSRPFRGRDVKIELGGGFVVPAFQPNMRREIERYGIQLVDHAPGSGGTPPVFASGGSVRTGLPVPAEELGALERAIVHMANASARLNAIVPLPEQLVSDLDVSPRRFFAPLRLPAATLDFLEGMIGGYLAVAPEGISMIDVLVWMHGFGDSPFALFIDAFLQKFAGGTGELLSAICEDAAAEVRLSTVVERMSVKDDVVTVTTADGEAIRARSCIVTVPVNTLDAIEFEPGLSEAKAAALAASTTSSGCKTFVLASGVPEGFFSLSGVAADDGRGTFQWLWEDARLEGGESMLIGFSIDNALVDVDSDMDRIKAAVAKLLPHATVIAADAHDWSGDPFSRGIVHVNAPGQGTSFSEVMTRPDGPIILAGSDVSTSLFRSGWMEGAVHQAHEAAHQVLVTR